MASNLSHGMKRVLSGIMALLIVVGSASISANGKKGGLFANYSITASAVSNVKECSTVAKLEASNIQGTQGAQAGEDCSGLFDTDTSTKWCVNYIEDGEVQTDSTTGRTYLHNAKKDDQSVYFTFTAGETAVTPTGYLITTGNDTDTCQNRSPVSWHIDGSNDGTTWATLTTVYRDTQLPQDQNNVTKEYSITNSGAYKYFRFTVDEILSDASDSAVQFVTFQMKIKHVDQEHDASGTKSWSWDSPSSAKVGFTCGNCKEEVSLDADSITVSGNSATATVTINNQTYTNSSTLYSLTKPNNLTVKQSNSTVSDKIVANAPLTVTSSIPVAFYNSSGTELSCTQSGNTYTLAKGNVTGNIVIRYKVTPTVVLSQTSYTYDGKEKKPTVTVYADSAKTITIPSSEYTVTYSNNTNAGTSAKVTVTDKSGGDYTLTKVDTTFTINKAANNVTFTSPQTVTKTFSTSAQTHALTAATGGQGNVTYAIQSQKQGNNNVNYFSISGSTLTIGANTPVGTYTLVVRATAAGNGNYNSGYKDSTINVTVNKANPSYTAPSGLTATYGQTLADVTLPSGWTWNNTSTNVGNAGSHIFIATFTPSDTNNYNTVSQSLNVTVNKATPSYTTPTGLTATYGQTLADVTLPSGWTWNNTSTNVGNAGSHTFSATFTPSDTNNYNTVSQNLTVTVNKADSSVTQAPVAKNPTYNGSNQALVSAGTANGGTMQYKVLTADNIQAAKTWLNTTDEAWAIATAFFASDIGSAWSDTVPEASDVGEYIVGWRITGNDNYNNDPKYDEIGSRIGLTSRYYTSDYYTTVTINPKNISTATITPASISDQNWTGSAISGLVTVSDVVDEKSIITANDYEITYSNNTNAGLSSAEAAPTVTINGKGNYTGTVTKNFNILAQLDLSDENVRAALQSITYNGATISFDTDNAPANAYYYLLGQDITLITTARLEFPDGFEVDEDWDDDVSYSYTFTIPDGTSTVKPERVYDYSFRTDNDKLYGDDAYNFADEEKLVATLNANSSEYLGDNNVSVTKSNEYEPDVTSVIKYQVKGANGRYSDMSNTPVNVGSYYVKSEVRTMNISFWLQKAFEITARPYADHTNEISVSLASSEFAFNGTAHQPVIIVKDTNEKLTEANQTLVEGRDYELGYLDADGNFVKFGSDGATDTLEKTNAGTYTVAVNFIGNYSGTTTIDWTIVTAVLPTLTISDASADYNGQAHEVEVAGVDNINDLITITYKQGETTLDGAPVNAGTYTAVITIKDTDYVFADGQITEQEFTISPKAITVTPSAVSKIFGNADPQFSCTTEDELANSEEQNFSEYIGRAAGEDTGTYGYNITNAIEGSLVVGNYQISIDPENTNVFTIDPLVITEPTITVNDPDAMIYNTLAQTPAITVKVGDIVIDESEYNVAYSENVNAGENTAIITITDKDGGNYTISGTANFTILPKVVDNPTITFTDTATATFTGSPLTPEFTVYDGETLISANEYDFTYSNNTNAGTGTVTLTDNAGGNYVISGSNTFGIAPMEVTEGLTIEIPNEDIIYDGTAKQPNVTVKVGDTVIDPSEYTVTYSNNTNAGEDTAGITITDNENGNYTINGSRYFTIIPKTVTEPTIVIPDDTIIYDGTAKEPAVTVFDGETQVNPNEYSVSYSNNINASEQAVIAITDNENGNYIISGSGTFTIVPKSIAGVTIADVTDTYVADGETSFEPVPVVNDGDITDNPLLIKDTDYTVSYSNNVHAGKGKIIITGKGNYSDTTFAEKEFDICSTIDLSAVSGQITSIKYQGSAVEANDTGKYSFLVDTNIEINSSVTLAFPENTVTLVSKKGTKNGYTYTVKILSAVDLVTVTHDSNYRITKVDNENELYGKDNNDKQAPEEKLAELTAIAPIYYLDIISDDIDENTDVNNVHLQTVENVNFTLTPDAYEYTAISDNALLKNELPYNAGTYNVRARVPYGGNNYYLNTNITVLSRNYNDNETEFTISASDLTFNGTAQTPVITITDNKLGETDNVLVEGTDYELGYMDGDTFVAFGSNGAAYTLAQTNADTYNIAVQFKGNYSGTAAVSWTMNRLNFEDNLTYTVTMEGKTTPELTNVKYGETALTKNTDYTVSDVESGNIVIIGAGNYIGTKTVVTHTAAVASTYTVPGNVEYWTYDNVNYVKDDEGKFVAAETVVVPVKNDATSAITGNELTDTANIIKFSYENTYAGTEAAEYRFLCYRGEEPIEELTFGMANVTDVKKDNATGTINVKDLGNGIYLRPYIKIGNENVYGNQVYVRYSDLMNQKAFAEATSAITGNELTDTANIIKFSYENTYAGTEAAEYRFLCYRGEEPIEELTFGMANVTDVKKDNATGTINVKDLGNGIYLRPYIKIGNENVYGNQVYVRYSDLMNQKAFAEATSAITGNELTDTANIIKFSYENTYAGTEAAEYRFLCYRGEEPIEELTFGMANVTDVKKDNATGTINVKDLGNGIYLRPYIKIGNENVYGNQVYVRYSDLMNQKAFAEATSAITGNELTDTANIIKFSYENTYAGTEAAEYRFLCYRGEEPIEELTFGMANVTDVKKDNATGTINVKDLGNGIYLRPYIKIGNENVYGNQVYVRYSDLMNQKAFAEATSAITGNELTDTANIIKFSYENTYAGTEAAEYRFLCYRGEEPIEELTFGMANVTDVKKDNATGTINVKDLGSGIYLRPYIKIGDQYKYGEQAFVKYSDLQE